MASRIVCGRARIGDIENIKPSHFACAIGEYVCKGEVDGSEWRDEKGVMESRHRRVSAPIACFGSTVVSC